VTFKLFILPGQSRFVTSSTPCRGNEYEAVFATQPNELHAPISAVPAKTRES